MNDIVFQANKTIMDNKECFVAQWILQNPDKKIQDYTMCYQPNLEGFGSYKFWMEKKSAEHYAREDKATVVDYYKKTLEALEQRVVGLKTKIAEAEKL